jgi:succinoglycan biosynthesis transport protein ExoP
VKAPWINADGRIFAPVEVLGQLSPSQAATEDGEINFASALQALRRRKRLALALFGVSLLSGALITAWQRTYRPTFQGSFKLLVSDPINNENHDSRLESFALPGSGSTDTSTLIHVLGSPMLLSPVEQKFGLADGDLMNITKISPPKLKGVKSDESGVLEVSLLWHDPVEGRQILEELSRSFLSYSLRQRQEKLTQGLAFLDQQAPELKSRVMKLENQLAAFRQSSGFVEPAEQATDIRGQLLVLSDSRRRLEQQQARLESMAAAGRSGKLASQSFQRRNAALGGDPSGQVGASSLAGGAFTPVLRDLAEVEKQLAEAEATYTEAAPQVQELRAKVDKLRLLLQRREQDSIQTSLLENQAELKEIWRQQKQLALRFQGNPVQMKQYNTLQQQLEVARDNLTSYIKARESFRLQVAQRTVPWAVMATPKFSSRPVQPNLVRNLLLSALLGGVAGLGVALLRDKLDHVFHSPKELQEGLDVPLLGVVPYLPGQTGNTISQSLEALEEGERFTIQEDLRNLFANFRLLRADKPVRLVAVTSSTFGEGKSTTSALFAQTLAQLGRRVLMVDSDMRRPMLHRYVGAHNQLGLSTLITDLEIPLEGVVHTVQPGLDLITAGPVPPDPAKLLTSERCRAVLQMIRNLPGYDLVIFDTPPALLLSDPVLLAEHLDGVIFLVGLSCVNRDLPAQALQRIQNTGVDVLGMLANQPVLRGFGSKPNDYGYGHRLGYDNYPAAAKYHERAAANGESPPSSPSLTPSKK